jgi:hypothetical protein
MRSIRHNYRRTPTPAEAFPRHHRPPDRHSLCSDILLDAMRDMADRIEAFARKITFCRAPPPPFEEGEHIGSRGKSCHLTHWRPQNASPPSSTAHQALAGCRVVGLTELQRLLLLRFGPSFLAGMDPDQGIV